MIIPGKFPRLVRAVAALAFAAALLPASAQNKTPLPQENPVSGHATGSFDVSLSPPKFVYLRMGSQLVSGEILRPAPTAQLNQAFIG